jgi:hypothetical protein
VKANNFVAATNGTSWTTVNTGFANTHVSHNCLVVNDSNLFAGTSCGGVWRLPAFVGDDNK